MSDTRKKSHYSVLNSLPVYLLIGILIAFLSFPTLANCVFFPFFKISNIEGYAFLNYKIFFIDLNHSQVLASMFFIYILVLMYFWMRVSSGKKSNVGNEHGTARWLSDEEFDDLIPWYIFRRNEQDYREEQIQTKFEILKTSSVDVLDELEFTPRFKEETNETVKE